MCIYFKKKNFNKGILETEYTYPVTIFTALPPWTPALWFFLGSSRGPQGPETPPICPEVVPWLRLVWDRALPPRRKNINKWLMSPVLQNIFTVFVGIHVIYFGLLLNLLSVMTVIWEEEKVVLLTFKIKNLSLTQLMSSNPGSSSAWGGRFGSWAVRKWTGESGGRRAALKKLVTLEKPPNVVA